jgi:hypothetical protein
MSQVILCMFCLPDRSIEVFIYCRSVLSCLTFFFTRPSYNAMLAKNGSMSNSNLKFKVKLLTLLFHMYILYSSLNKNSVTEALPRDD